MDGFSEGEVCIQVVMDTPPAVTNTTKDYVSHPSPKVADPNRSKKCSWIGELDVGNKAGELIESHSFSDLSNRQN